MKTKKMPVWLRVCCMAIIVCSVVGALASVVMDGGEDKPSQAVADDSPNPRAQEALIKAAKDGTAAEVRAAKKDGADTQWLTDGYLPVHWAAGFNTDPSVISPLLAFINAEFVTKDGMTALMIAAKLNPNPDVVLAILKAGADPGARNPQNGRNAYYYGVNNPYLHGTEALRRLRDGQY